MSKKNKKNPSATEVNVIPNIKIKDRYCKHLTPEENQMLDIIADIITGHVLKNGDKT